MTIVDTFKELQVIYQQLVPKMLTRFQPGASEESIRAAEDAIGLEFPNDLRELMKFANGQVSIKDRSSPYYDKRDGHYGIHLIFPQICYPTDWTRSTDSAWWASLEDLVEQTQLFRETIKEMEDETYEEIGPAKCHPNMIGFTITENASSLLIDLEPKPGGTVGQVVMVSTQPSEVVVLSPSLHSFLSFIKDGFASDLFYCEDPNYGIWCDTRFIPPPKDNWAV